MVRPYKLLLLTIMLDFILYILLGALAGFIAGKLTKGSGFGFWINIVVGIVGGWLGGFLCGLLGLWATSLVGKLIVSVIGACVLLWILSLINGGRAQSSRPRKRK